MVSSISSMSAYGPVYNSSTLGPSPSAAAPSSPTYRGQQTPLSVNSTTQALPRGQVHPLVATQLATVARSSAQSDSPPTNPDEPTEPESTYGNTEEPRNRAGATESAPTPEEKAKELEHQDNNTRASDAALPASTGVIAEMTKGDAAP